MKYKVTYTYRGHVTVEVEAADEAAAFKAGMEEADSDIGGALSLIDWDVKEVE